MSMEMNSNSLYKDGADVLGRLITNPFTSVSTSTADIKVYKIDKLITINGNVSLSEALAPNAIRSIGSNLNSEIAPNSSMTFVALSSFGTTIALTINKNFITLKPLGATISAGEAIYISATYYMG